MTKKFCLNCVNVFDFGLVVPTPSVETLNFMPDLFCNQGAAAAAGNHQDDAAAAGNHQDDVVVFFQVDEGANLF